MLDEGVGGRAGGEPGGEDGGASAAGAAACFPFLSGPNR